MLGLNFMSIEKPTFVFYFIFTQIADV